MNSFLSAAGPWAPLVVFALAAAESAAFVGLVIPGELAVILGGVVAGTGAVSLWVMIPAAVLGAIIGDSIGYYLGHRTGPALLRQERLRKVSQYMDRASKLLAERGWWALVVARFASVLRAVVPFAAGMGEMPYRRFLLGNLVGGVAWGTLFTLAGYIAGANYTVVEKWFRTGGLAVVGLALLVGGIVWLTRWTQHNRGKVDAFMQRLTSTGPARLLHRITSKAPLTGLALAATATGIVASTWLFAGLIQDVVGSEEFFFFDLSAIRYLADNPIAQLVTGARLVNIVTDPRLIAALAAIAVVLAAVVLRRRRPAAALVFATAGQWLIVEVTAALVDRAPPGVTPFAARVDYGFPSEHVALLTAVALVAAWPWNHPGWSATVRRFGLALTAIFLTGSARVLLLVEYPSDVLAAGAIAAAWTLLICVTFSIRSDTVSPVTQTREGEQA
ncbi:MAG: VTT domain-containing protein [Acidimicrobiia bacterium]